MKYTWEDKDIVGGKYAINGDSPNLGNVVYLGYEPISGKRVIIAMSDGCIYTSSKQKSIIAKWLNDGKYSPISKKEFIEVLKIEERKSI